MKENILNPIRVTIATVCVILFILQSYQEVDKYFKRMTSVAVRIEEHNEVPYPSILVCPKEGFKEGVFSTTIDEYLNRTYSSDEIIENVSPYDLVKVTEIATFGRGRCVFLEVPENLGHSTWDLHVSVHVPSSAYIVERGQEMCVMYLAPCPSPPVMVSLESGDTYMAMWKIRPVKKILSNG